MSASENIGFVGGGMMGEALIKGLLAAGLYSADQIRVAEPSGERREQLRTAHGVAVYEESGVVWQECETVILAVKPQVIAAVLSGSSEYISQRHLVISIAAGVPLAALEEAVAGSGCRFMRVMPNTPAIVQECAAAISPGMRATEEDQLNTVRIFNAIGTGVIVDESLLDAVTGLSGSGPAYVFSFIEALIDAGVRTGLNRQIARKLVLQTVLGSVKLAISENRHMAELRDMVTSPGGTTAAGLHCLEKAGFHGLIMDAVKEAADRSKELGAAFTKKSTS